MQWLGYIRPWEVGGIRFFVLFVTKCTNQNLGHIRIVNPDLILSVMGKIANCKYGRQYLILVRFGIIHLSNKRRWNSRNIFGHQISRIGMLDLMQE